MSVYQDKWMTDPFVLKLYFYRPQGKVIFSQASDILSTISLIATRYLLILVAVHLVSILLECFFV